MQRLVRGHESSLRSDFCDHGLGPRGTARQRKQGDGRCCLALHVTKPKPLNRNFQSWRCLVIAPLTAHTKTLCFYYRRPVSFPRCSIIPKQPPPTRHLHQHSQHGSHILASVRPSLGKEGDENSHGWSRCRRKDHHPLQVEAR